MRKTGTQPTVPTSCNGPCALSVVSSFVNNAADCPAIRKSDVKGSINTANACFWEAPKYRLDVNALDLMPFAFGLVPLAGHAAGCFVKKEKAASELLLLSNHACVQTTTRIQAHTDDVNAVCYGEDTPNIIVTGSDDALIKVRAIY